MPTYKMFFIFLFFHLFQSGFASSPPVFLLDYDQVMTNFNIAANPFSKVTPTLFKEIIKDAVKTSACVVIFVEESLCTEDLRQRDYLGTPFHHLNKALQQKKALYIPYSTEPFQMLKNKFQETPVNEFVIGSGQQLDVPMISNYLYVYFQDSPETPRMIALRKHDLSMKEFYFTLRQLKGGPIVGFYTGKINPIDVKSWHRIMIRARPPKYNGMVIVTNAAMFRLAGRDHLQGCLIRISSRSDKYLQRYDDKCLKLATETDSRGMEVGIFSESATRRASFSEINPSVHKETRTRRMLSTTMQYSDFQLQFNFKFRSRDWNLDNVVLLEAGEEVGRTRMDVGAPWNWSYFCAEPLTIINMRDGSSITVSQYQIQPIYRHKLTDDGSGSDAQGHSEPDPPSAGLIQSIRSKRVDTGSETTLEPAAGPAPTEPPSPTQGSKTVETKFGETVNCGPYFSSHILTALMVVGIVLSITMWGILMMMDCNSNATYDDPNGKPLVIGMEH